MIRCSFLLTYLLAAVQRLAPGLVNRTQALLSAPQIPQVENLISSLLSDLGGLQNATFLILDDEWIRYRCLRLFVDLLSTKQLSILP